VFAILELDEGSDAQHQRLQQLGPIDTRPPRRCGQVGEVRRYCVENREAAVEVDVARLGPTGPELGVGSARGDQLAGVVETVEGVVADRLQQPIPRFPRRVDAVGATSDLSAR
jgi:hypothetical protein